MPTFDIITSFFNISNSDDCPELEDTISECKKIRKEYTGFCSDRTCTKPTDCPITHICGKDGFCHKHSCEDNSHVCTTQTDCPLTHTCGNDGCCHKRACRYVFGGR